jgi:hypothetical protein
MPSSCEAPTQVTLTTIVSSTVSISSDASCPVVTVSIGTTCPSATTNCPSVTTSCPAVTTVSVSASCPPISTVASSTESCSATVVTSTATITVAPSGNCFFPGQVDPCFSRLITSQIAVANPGCSGIPMDDQFVSQCVCAPIANLQDQLSRTPSNCNQNAAVAVPALLGVARGCACAGQLPPCDYYLDARPDCVVQAVVAAGAFYTDGCLGAGTDAAFYSSCVCAQPPASLGRSVSNFATDSCATVEIDQALIAQASYCGCAVTAAP